MVSTSLLGTTPSPGDVGHTVSLVASLLFDIEWGVHMLLPWLHRFFAKDLFYCITTQSANPLSHDDRDSAHPQGEDFSQELVAVDPTHSHTACSDEVVVQDQVDVAQDTSVPTAGTGSAGVKDCSTVKGEPVPECRTSNPSSPSSGRHQARGQRCPVIDL